MMDNDRAVVVGKKAMAVTIIVGVISKINRQNWSIKDKLCCGRFWQLFGQDDCFLMVVNKVTHHPDPVP